VKRSKRTPRVQAEADAIRARTRKLIKETQRLLLQISANRAAYRAFLVDTVQSPKKRAPSEKRVGTGRSSGSGKSRERKQGTRAVAKG
jgi:hypothetical protein